MMDSIMSLPYGSTNLQSRKRVVDHERTLPASWSEDSFIARDEVRSLRSPYAISTSPSRGRTSLASLPSPMAEEMPEERTSSTTGAATLIMAAMAAVPLVFSSTKPAAAGVFSVGRTAVCSEMFSSSNCSARPQADVDSTEENANVASRAGKSLLEQALRKGMSGEKVEKLQRGLGRFVGVKATGVFDDATEQAVSDFQRMNGLPANGVVDNMTYGVLWTRSFWEKGVALDINGADFYRSIPKDVKVLADLSRLRISLMDPASGRVIREYPMSPGGPGHETPTGSFEITEITEKPWWYPPSSPWAAGAKPTPPGPRNPLGPMKMRVGSSSVLFHGVPISKFDSLGKYAASHGCLRMFPQDAWELHRIVSKGTRVEIIPGK